MTVHIFRKVVVMWLYERAKKNHTPQYQNTLEYFVYTTNPDKCSPLFYGLVKYFSGFDRCRWKFVKHLIFLESCRLPPFPYLGVRLSGRHARFIVQRGIGARIHCRVRLTRETRVPPITHYTLYYNSEVTVTHVDIH